MFSQTVFRRMIIFENYTFSGAPRVAHAVVKLPLKLVMKPVLPVKNANFKITVDTNKPPVNLNDIFPGKSCDHAIPDAKVSSPPPISVHSF